MDIAVVLLVAGILLIAAEFCRPGWVWPGVLGGVAAIYGGYQMPVGPLLELLASSGFAFAAGSFGWPKWTGAIGGAASIAASTQLGVHWLTALSAALPALALYWLMTVAAKALANKTIVG